MCFKTKTKSQSYQSQTSGPEQWVRDTGQGIFNQAQTLAQQPYQSNPLKVAQYGEDFSKARNLLSGLTGDTGDYADARKAYTSVAGADDASKSVEDYMNPWLQAVLSPTLAKIREQGDLNRQRLNAQATMSGAFGDARHGVLEGQLARDEAQTVGDTTGKLYAQGYDTATQARNAALNRILSAGQASQGLGTSMSSVAQLLASLADKSRSVEQAQNDATKAEADRATKYPYEQLTWLLQMLNQTPANQTSTGAGTNIQTGTDNSGLQLLGKLIAAPLTGGLSLAVPGGK